MVWGYFLELEKDRKEATNQAWQSLKKASGYRLIIRRHAAGRSRFRNISKDIIEKVVRQPGDLVLAYKQESKFPGEDKFSCYFLTSRDMVHHYVLAINHTKRHINVVTVKRILKSMTKKFQQVINMKGR